MEVPSTREKTYILPAAPNTMSFRSAELRSGIICQHCCTLFDLHLLIGTDKQKMVCFPCSEATLQLVYCTFLLDEAGRRSC